MENVAFIINVEILIKNKRYRFACEKICGRLWVEIPYQDLEF